MYGTIDSTFSKLVLEFQFQNCVHFIVGDHHLIASSTNANYYCWLSYMVPCGMCKRMIRFEKESLEKAGFFYKFKDYEVSEILFTLAI